MQVSPYLNFNGNCRAAFEFYEKNLGGKIEAMMTHGEAPGGGPPGSPPEWASAILHARIRFGDSVLMASDIPPERQRPMRSAYLSLNVDGVGEAEKAFAALSQGAEITMPIQETFWALRFAMLRDQFGTLWMINAERPMPGS